MGQEDERGDNSTLCAANTGLSICVDVIHIRQLIQIGHVVCAGCQLRGNQLLLLIHLAHVARASRFRIIRWWPKWDLVHVDLCTVVEDVFDGSLVFAGVDLVTERVSFGHWEHCDDHTWFQQLDAMQSTSLAAFTQVQALMQSTPKLGHDCSIHAVFPLQAL